MKYVFLDDHYDQGHFLMSDLENHQDCKVIYKDRLHQNAIINAFCCSHIIRKIKKRLRMPFRERAYHAILHRYCDADTQAIFMTTGWYCDMLIGYIRMKYPHIRLVMLIRDTVKNNADRNKEFEIGKIKRLFDLVISYDNVHDVPVYGLTYAPVYMSKTDSLDMSSLTCKYDITFIGAAKDRLDLIHRIYQNCMAHDLKAFFYIFHVRRSKKLSHSGITYSRRYLKRLMFLEMELEANCIMEILKGDAHSNTTRFWEAVIYNKKFYTNWKGIVDSPYYNPKYIKVFDDPDDLDYDFIRERIDVDYNYQGELSPLKYIDLFKQLL